MDQSAHNFSTPEVLETIGRQLGVAHCMLDDAVGQASLQCTGIMPLVGQRESTACRSIWGRALRPSPAAPARSTSRANPAVVKGEPRACPPGSVSARWSWTLVALHFPC